MLFFTQSRTEVCVKSAWSKAHYKQFPTLTLLAALSIPMVISFPSFITKSCPNRTYASTKQQKKSCAYGKKQQTAMEKFESFLISTDVSIFCSFQPRSEIFYVCTMVDERWGTIWASLAENSVDVKNVWNCFFLRSIYWKCFMLKQVLLASKEIFLRWLFSTNNKKIIPLDLFQVFY